MTDKAPELTTHIVAAFLAKQRVAVTDLPQLIGAVHRALSGIADGAGGPEPDATPPTPTVPIRRSVTPDHIICLEDGRRFRSIKRHLQTAHGLEPAAYRARWGLKKDYPMVAKNYSEQRSNAAKAIGLGQAVRKPAELEVKAAPAPETEVSAPALAVKRARRPKAAVTPEA